MPDGYTTKARLMHWLIALLVLLMIPAGLIMIREGVSRPMQDTLFLFHKNTGVIVLLLMVLRLAFRIAGPTPPTPAHLPGWQRMAADASHFLLYVLLFVMPLSGYIRVRAGNFPIEALDAMGVPALVPRSKELAEAAQSVHEYGAYLLMLILAVHVAAALQHALIHRDGVFARMWPPVSR